jgi:uncharacterized protein
MIPKKPVLGLDPRMDTGFRKAIMPKQAASAGRRAPYIPLMRDVKTRNCPICVRPADERFKPFCSKRCADVDLHRWLSGSYAIPVVEEETQDEADGERRQTDGGETLN